MPPAILLTRDPREAGCGGRARYAPAKRENEKRIEEYIDRVQAIVWRCPCGGTLRLSGYGAAPFEGRGIWRYLRGLPLDASRIVSMGEGDTPLIERRIGGRAAWFKLDYLAPTGSYKDRGMSGSR